MKIKPENLYKNLNKKTIYTLFLLTITITILSKFTSQRSQQDRLPYFETTLYYPQICDPNKIVQPVDIYRPMKYSDFKISLKDFKTFHKAMVNKVEPNIYRIDSEEDMGSIVYNGLRFKIEKAWVISPSQHRIEGNEFNVEVQLICTNGDRRVILTKLLLEDVEIDPKAQHGLGQFMFGTTQLSFLEREPDLQWQLDQIEKEAFDKIPLYFHEVSGSPMNYVTFFDGDSDFLMYQGQQTSEECQDSIYIISLTPAILSREQMKDFTVNDKTRYYFKTQKSTGKVTVFQNQTPDEPPKPSPPPRNKPKDGRRPNDRKPQNDRPPERNPRNKPDSKNREPEAPRNAPPKNDYNKKPKNHDKNKNKAPEAPPPEKSHEKKPENKSKPKE